MVGNNIMKKYIHFTIIMVLVVLVGWVGCGKKEKAEDLKSQLSKVKHQGRRNTCSVLAATALMEYLIKMETGKELDLSENYNYWCAKKYALTEGYIRDTYTGIDGLAGYLAVEGYKYGCMEESEWPYEIESWEGKGDTRYRYIEGKPVMENFTGTPPINANTIPFVIEPIYIEKEDVKDFILREAKPVVFNILWSPDAVDNKTGAIRMLTDEEVNAAMGHVILLVGYNEKAKTFTFRNSWGEEWGDQGYGTFPEEYILKHYEAAKFEPLDQYDQEVQDLLIKATQGISGKLKNK